jgi:hypothetical protein
MAVDGQSGGASAIAYALGAYPVFTQVPAAPSGRATNLIDRACLCSGPPHAAVFKGCNGDTNFDYTNTNADLLDAARGYATTTGPCYSSDAATGGAWWNQEGLATGRFDRDYTGTAVHVILGSADTTVAPYHSDDWMARLDPAKFSRQVTTGTPHGLSADTTANTAISDFVLDKIRARRAVQGAAVTAGTTVTADLTTATDTRAVNVGTLLKASVYASTTNTNLTLPAGWAWATDEDGNVALTDYNAGAACVGIAWKKAAVGDGSLTVTSSVACNMELRIVEMLGFTNPMVDVCKATTATASSLTITAPENMSILRVAAFCALGFTAGKSSGNTWTNSFIRGANVTGRYESSAKFSFAGITAPTTAESVAGGSGALGGVMAVFRET